MSNKATRCELPLSLVLRLLTKDFTNPKSLPFMHKQSNILRVFITVDVLGSLYIQEQKTHSKFIATDIWKSRRIMLIGNLQENENNKIKKSYFASGN